MNYRVDRRAFTLVELLVVVAIIAILVALLMPALADAKRHAMDVRCLAQERGIGMAEQLYVTDNTDSEAPSVWNPYQGNGTNEQDLEQLMTPYCINSTSTASGQVDVSSTKKIFQCPSVIYPSPVQQYPNTYGCNTDIHVLQVSPTNNVPVLRRQTQILRPQELVCVADSSLQSGAETCTGTLYYTYLTWDNPQAFPPNGLYDTFGPIASQGDGDVAYEFTPGPYLVCYRHGTDRKVAANVVYEDVHGETVAHKVLQYKNFAISY
jgi:prepilin-type N-terminal cleavage/methylation domain-containing protein